MDQVRHISYQLCYSVKFLHDNKLTHTDLKPENILFVNSDYSSTFNARKVRNSRALIHFTTNRDFFRRIAIFVGSKTPTFVWSILAARHLIMNITALLCRHAITELQKLFSSWVGRSLAMCGPLDASCSSSTLALRSSKRTTIANIWRWWKEFSARFHTEWRGTFFIFLPSNDANWTTCSFAFRKTKTKYFFHGKLDWDEKSSAGRYVRDHCKPLHRYVMSEIPDHLQLFDLIRRMLDYDPTTRITLGEWMQWESQR